ncbi:MAG: hypothetical protein WD669_12970 [Pirellulales bacterium]
MDARLWLKQLRAELAKRRLPPAYVERFVGELSDHLSESLEDRMSMDAQDLHGVFERLGAPGQVASAAAQEYRKARFSRRHPVLMFVVLPILALPVLWFGYVVCMLIAAKMLGLETGKVDTNSLLWQWADACTPFVVLGLLLVPVSVAAAFFCRLANKAGLSWKWTIAACALLAVFGGLAMSDFALPTEYSRGEFKIGYRLASHPTASQALQFLLPLSIGGWAVWRKFKGSHDVGPALGG